MLQGEVLVLELLTVDGLAAGSVVVGEVTALHGNIEHVVNGLAEVSDSRYARWSLGAEGLRWHADN